MHGHLPLVELVYSAATTHIKCRTNFTIMSVLYYSNAIRIDHMFIFGASAR